MSDMLTKGTDSIRKYSYLVTKMKFPISTIPTFVNISNFIIHLLLMAIMILIFIFMGYPPSIYIVQLPLYMLFNFLFFNVFSLVSGLISAISKDFANLVKSFITAIFWLSGIIWDASTVTIPWIKKLLRLNPFNFLVEGYKNCFINQTWFFEEPKRLLYFGIELLILILIGLWAYKKVRKEIPDVL